MIRLGLRLSLSSGREAAARLALIVVGVAAGVAVLLATLSLFNAFQATDGRPCWECTTGSAPSGWALDATADGALWNYHEDFYAGRTIKRLDAAALGTRAPVVPGLSRMPGPGQYYASPALAALLDSAPREELAARFPGTRAGLIGDVALSGPDELVIVVGQTPDQVAAMPGARQVDTVSAVSTMQAVDDSADVYRFGFGVAAVGLIVPLLVLVGTATRLAAARRETRFAAIRLVGATARQINVLATVDAALGGLAGALAGLAIFQLVRPAVAGVRITGARFFPELVAPHAWQYAAVLGGVPVVAACAALWSLRRVRISPLGVARKTAASPPRAWRVIPLLAGLGMFTGPVYRNGKPDDLLAVVALALVMAGLMLAGPWLTMAAARLAARLTRGGATLLAARRLAADPKTAFRSVSGLVLAVFIGTTIAALVPTVVAGQQKVAGGTLNDVLGARFDRPGVSGLSPRAGTELLDRLHARPGVDVLPIYALPIDAGPRPDGSPPAPYAVECADLARFPALGRCPVNIDGRNARAVAGNFARIVGADNPLTVDRLLPLAGPASPTASTDGLGLAAVMITTRDPATLERLRTLLSGHTVEAPMTFAEVAEVRADLYVRAENVALAMVGLTLVAGACGLVVAAAGGLVERRQPFTLLRLAGTPTRTLAAVVLLESALPLVLAAALAAGSGFGVAEPLIDALAMRSASIAMPGPVYFASLGGGLAASLLVILTTLPLLRRMTTPGNARFE
ncbi:FtsX-like permease family protein [Microbispora cellulosiformans]|uniref:FtsX-like permease family protein n=1 Tax=Microbispora cellulosiformans TaxID=2614688 RepID=A0A5J5K1Q9_9ACTN|nr:FtsX-like permease family protein [Microbispora cellulosiformans]KAA9376951.1 FtsX-like permease family protein [Microbispora cellulosiformans]